MSQPEKNIWNNFYARFSPAEIAARAGKIGVVSEIEDYLYINEKFMEAIGDPAHKKILSLGGGLDIIALGLALRGALVTCRDSSCQAAEKTKAAAKILGLKDNFTYQIAGGETLDLNNQFHICLAHRSLHHLDINQAIPKIQATLMPGGYFLAQEPVGLNPLLRAIHQWLPFHPNYPFDPEEEHELTKAELDFIKRNFAQVSLEFFECFSRNSLAYLIYKIGGRRMIYHLSKIDFFLIKWLPVLKWLSTYCLIKATKN